MSIAAWAYPCVAGDHSYCEGAAKGCACFCHSLRWAHPWKLQVKRIASRLQRSMSRRILSSRANKYGAKGATLRPPPPPVRPVAQYHDQPLDDDLVEAIFDPSQPWGSFGVFDTYADLREYIGNRGPENDRLVGEDKQEAQRRHVREEIERRKQLGLCTRWGCNEQASPNRTRCEPHRQEDVRRLQRHRASKIPPEDEATPRTEEVSDDDDEDRK